MQAHSYTPLGQGESSVAKTIAPLLTIEPCGAFWQTRLLAICMILRFLARYLHHDTRRIFLAVVYTTREARICCFVAREQTGAFSLVHSRIFMLILFTHAQEMCGGNTISPHRSVRVGMLHRDVRLCIRGAMV